MYISSCFEFHLFPDQTPPPPKKKLESPPKVLKVEKVEETEKHPNTIEISDNLIDIITPTKHDKEEPKKSGKIENVSLY